MKPVSNADKLDHEQIENIWHKADCSRGDEAYLRDDIFDVINSLNALIEENRTLQQQVNTLTEALKLAMPIVEHQSPTRAQEIKRLMSIKESPKVPNNPHDWRDNFERSEQVCAKCGGTYWIVGDGGWYGECPVESPREEQGK